MTSISDSKENSSNEVRFYTSPYYELDNFSAHQVCIWGKIFPTAEHAYQWKKFAESNPALADEILRAPSPYAVKQLSDAHKHEVQISFTGSKCNVMEEILRAKARQHTDVRNALVESGRKIIVENSPVDSFWGIGSEGDGENMLGKLWMQIRSAL
jgi:ribA/ribD-fused uncharacterized protein